MTVQFATVVVVAPEKRMVCATVFVLEIVLKVFESKNDRVEIPVVPPISRSLYVNPPPIKPPPITDVSVNAIFDVAGVNVKFVDTTDQTAPVPAKDKVPDFINKVLTNVPFEESNIPVEKFLPFKSKVPIVNVVVLEEPTVKLSCSTQVAVPLETPNVIGKSKVVPFEVIVFVPVVAANDVILAPDAQLIPVEHVKFPYILLVEFTTVPAKPVKFKLR